MNDLSPAHPPAALSLRDVVPLDGLWDFRHEADGDWRVARVPAPWQACFPDLEVQFGRVTYRRTFRLPDEWTSSAREIALCFGAVSETAVISVNGIEIGRHEGAYLPFEVVIPPALLRAENTLEVVATLPDAQGDPALGAPGFAEYPHGKQSWYGPQGGIWQSVRLEARPALHLAGLRLDPHWPDGRLDIAARFSGFVAGGLRIEVAEPSGRVVHSSVAEVRGDHLATTVRLADIAAWSPDAPNLYRLHLTLQDAGGELDRRVESFGFRLIEAREGCLFLNGKPFYMRGALDQDYYPDGFGTPPSLELLEDQARKAKAMGLNLLRCHIKVPDPRYYEVADRLGLLVWTEIPNIETFNDASARRLRATMEGILARDRNHPSIVIWTLINEDWGTRLREMADQRHWLSEMVDWLRAEDPLRLVVDNSACFPNIHVKTDINDFHFYRAVTERREEWHALCAEFAGAADWTFFQGPGAEWTRSEPLILSEFGMWGLPNPKLLHDEHGREPWWMAYGAMWADTTALPAGSAQRFAELGLQKVFGTFDAFIDAVQWHQYLNLKYEIEVIRTHAPIAGYVITEFTDVHWEGNGLMDMARNPRVFARALPDVNADVVIAPGLPHHAARAGATLAFDLRVATGGAALPEGARLDWSFAGQAGSAALPATGPMRVAHAPVQVPVPADAATGVGKAVFTVTAPDGTVLSRNDEQVSVFAARPEPSRVFRFCTDSEALAQRLVNIGHELVREIDAEVFVTQGLDALRINAINGGARVLQVLSDDPLVPDRARWADDGTDMAPEPWRSSRRAEGIPGNLYSVRPVQRGSGRLRDDTPPRDGPMSMHIEDSHGGMVSGSYFTFPGYYMVNRHKSIWRGDWVGNFSWLRRDGAFAHVPGGPMFDLSFSRVVPHQVLLGFRPWEFHGRVHAGVVVGWVHKPAAFLFDKRLGRGKLTCTTFRLHEDPPDADPLATALYDGLLDLASRP